MKKRTLVIGLSTFEDVIKETVEACKKARPGQPFGAVYRIDFPDQKTLFNTLSSRRMDLLKYLRNHASASNKKLAKQLNSSIRGVETDIKLLSRLGLIQTDTSGRYFVPWDDIQVPLAA